MKVYHLVTFNTISLVKKNVVLSEILEVFRTFLVKSR